MLHADDPFRLVQLVQLALHRWALAEKLGFHDPEPVELHADILMSPVWLLQLVQLAMDRRAREREQASLAISALAAAGLQEKQLTFAFEELLLNLEVGLHI